MKVKTGNIKVWKLDEQDAYSEQNGNTQGFTDCNLEISAMPKNAFVGLRNVVKLFRQ